MEFTSPRNTALNQTLQSSPITISPQSVAFGAMKQFFPHEGFFPFIANKKGIQLKFEMRNIDERKLPLQPRFGIDILLSCINIKSTSPLPSSFTPALPITWPVFTLSPRCTLAEARLLYTVKY